MDFTKTKGYIRWALFFFLMPFFSFISLIGLASALCIKFFSTNDKILKIKTIGLSFIMAIDVIILWLIERRQYSGMVNDVDDWVDNFFSFSLNFSKTQKAITFKLCVRVCCIFDVKRQRGENTVHPDAE